MLTKEIIFTTTKKDTFCETFVYEPSNIEEAKLGHLIMLGRVNEVAQSQADTLNILASRIKREYFSDLTRAPIKSFQSALKSANSVLKERETSIEWAIKLDFLVAVVFQNYFYLAKLGKTEAFILRGNSVLSIENPDQENELSFMIPFNSVIEGSLEKDDAIIFTSAGLFTKELLLSQGSKLLPITQEKTEALFASQGLLDNSIALIIEKDKKAQPIETVSYFKPNEPLSKKMARFGAKISGVAASVTAAGRKAGTFAGKVGNATVAAASKTKSLIRLPKKQSPPKEESNIISALSSTESEDPAQQRISSAQDFSEGPETQEESLASKTVQPTVRKDGFSIFKKAPVEREQLIKKTTDILSGIQPSVAKTKQATKNSFSKIFDLARNKRVFVPTITIVVLVVIVAITTAGIKAHSTSANIAKINQEITAKISTADTATNKNDAINLLNEAQAIAQTLPEGSQRNATEAQIAEKLDTLMGIDRLSKLTPLFSMGSSPISQNITPEKIALVGSNFFLFNPENVFAYKYTLSTSAGSFETLQGSNVSNIFSIGDTQAEFSSPNQVILESSTGSVVKRTLSTTTGFTPTSLATYETGPYIYLYDSATGSVLRFTYSSKTSSFSQATSWLKAPLPGAVSIAIDGSIYFLMPDGSVKVYSAGKQTGTLNIKANKAKKIVTSSTNKYLFILYGENKVGVFDKTGNIIKNFLFSDLTTVNDFTVSLDQKNLYVLSGKDVYSVDISTL